MKKALLVIDMQEFCIGKNHAEFFQYDANLISLVNQVIDENKDNLIVYIRNVMKKNSINKFAPFEAYEKSTEIELVEGLHIVSEYVFDKFVADAFSNKQLDEFLKENGTQFLEIIGVDGGGCVPLTAIGACKLGYKVTINTIAVNSMFKDKEEKFHKKLIGMGAKFIT